MWKKGEKNEKNFSKKFQQFLFQELDTQNRLFMLFHASQSSNEEKNHIFQGPQDFSRERSKFTEFPILDLAWKINLFESKSA